MIWVVQSASEDGNDREESVKTDRELEQDKNGTSTSNTPKLALQVCHQLFDAHPLTEVVGSCSKTSISDIVDGLC